MENKSFHSRTCDYLRSTNNILIVKTRKYFHNCFFPSKETAKLTPFRAPPKRTILNISTSVGNFREISEPDWATSFQWIV